MKLNITLPSGITIDFEGDAADFERFTALLDQLPERVENLGPSAQPPEKTPGEGGAGENNPPQQSESMSASDVEARIDRVNASDHIKRLTVMAQAAVDAGMDGIDFGTAERLYSEIGIPKPGSFKSAFGNARTKGFLRSVSRGHWRPTTRSENFARYGIDASRAKRGADANGAVNGGETD